MQQHKTKKVKIKNKFYDIDVGVIPLIKWFNSFDGIQTLNSCEGYGPHTNSIGQTETNYPYIMFRSNNEESLKQILERFSYSNIHHSFKISYWGCHRDFIDYTVHWYSREEFQDMIKFVQSGKRIDDQLSKMFTSHGYKLNLLELK